MSLKTIITPNDPEVIMMIPDGARIIIDATHGDIPEQLIQSKLLRVDRVLIEVDSLDVFTSSLHYDSGHQMVVKLRRTPEISSVIKYAPRLVKPRVTVETPLKTQQDLVIVKILTSLKVQTRLNIRELELGSELVEDCLMDHLLSIVDRAPLTPFREMLGNIHDDQFEVAALVYEDNSQHLDLRHRTGPVMEEQLVKKDLREERARFIIENHACCFCEGMPFCFGYLKNGDDLTGCKKFCSAFYTTCNLVLPRNTIKAEDPHNAPARPGD